MKMLKKTCGLLLTFALLLSVFQGLFANEEALAASKPAKPVITVKAGSDGKSAVITIAATKGAKGYQIAVKKPGAKKFKKLAVIKEDGSAERTYTAKDLSAGKYSFKAKAYTKSGKKTVYGKYGKAVSLAVGTADGGKDDSGTVYITSQKELAAIDAANTKAKYVLKNDIDMKGWTTPLAKVCCTIDGAGHVLKNLSVPFIGGLYGGTVENIIFDLKLTDYYLYQDYKVVAPIGFLAGGNNLEVGTVRNCKSVGSINCAGGDGLDPYDYNDAIDVGGIVAFNPNNLGYIERCVNEADITIKGYPNAAIGGIVGMCGGGTTREVVVECKNAGNIDTDTQRYTQSYCGIGGICGNQSALAIIRDCLNTGTVRDSADSEECPRKGAGISGAINNPIIENCVTLGASDYAIAGAKISAQTIQNWSYSSAHFTNVYYDASIGGGFMWEGSPADVDGVSVVSDITDESVFAGLDFKNVWKMGENGPELRNIP